MDVGLKDALHSENTCWKYLKHYTGKATATEVAQAVKIVP